MVRLPTKRQNIINIFFLDFERGAIKLQGIQNFLHEIHREKLSFMATGMSCLVVIVTEMSDEWELHKLITTMHDLKITKKYLFATLDTFNTTIFRNSTINFNVMINHKEGMLQLV